MKEHMPFVLQGIQFMNTEGGDRAVGVFYVAGAETGNQIHTPSSGQGSSSWFPSLRLAAVAPCAARLWDKTTGSRRGPHAF